MTTTTTTTKAQTSGPVDMLVTLAEQIGAVRHALADPMRVPVDAFAAALFRDLDRQRPTVLGPLGLDLSLLVALAEREPALTALADLQTKVPPMPDREAGQAAAEALATIADSASVLPPGAIAGWAEPIGPSVAEALPIDPTDREAAASASVADLWTGLADAWRDACTTVLAATGQTKARRRAASAPRDPSAPSGKAWPRDLVGKVVGPDGAEHKVSRGAGTAFNSAKASWVKTLEIGGTDSAKALSEALVDWQAAGCLGTFTFEANGGRLEVSAPTS